MARPPSEEKVAVVTGRVSAAEMAQLDAMAAKMGTTRAELIRLAVRDFLLRHRKS